MMQMHENPLSALSPEPSDEIAPPLEACAQVLYRAVNRCEDGWCYYCHSGPCPNWRDVTSGTVAEPAWLVEYNEQAVLYT